MTLVKEFELPSYMDKEVKETIDAAKYIYDEGRNALKSVPAFTQAVVESYLDSDKSGKSKDELSDGSYKYTTELTRGGDIGIGWSNLGLKIERTPIDKNSNVTQEFVETHLTITDHNEIHRGSSDWLKKTTSGNEFMFQGQPGHNSNRVRLKAKEFFQTVRAGR